MVVSAIHQHESAIGIYRCPPSLFPPHPTSLGCHKAGALGSQRHTANSHWLSLLHMVIICFNAALSNHPTPSFVSKSLLCLLPCKWDHQYSLSRCHIYALIYDICHDCISYVHSGSKWQHGSPAPQGLLLPAASCTALCFTCFTSACASVEIFYFCGNI